MNRLLSELRRRNVFRVAAAYLVVGWMVMQIVSVMTPALELPGWVDGFFAVLLMAGLPVALLLAWAFEMTPAGVKKTEAAEGEVEMRPLGSTDFVLIGLMVAVLGVVGFQMISRGDAPADLAQVSDVITTPIVDIDTVEAPVLDASIAVLPFADFSPAGDQQYFSDGISEELLNALAQFPELRVAARTSAFSFRGDDVDLREVGRVLGVAHVLEGSVRHAGGRIRITAQLIRVSDGFHLWSETYERTLEDVFAVQDEIVTELSRVLQVRLGVGAGIGRAGSNGVNAQAYEQYLRGLSLWGDREDNANRRNAYIAFQRATEYDANFADAWAALGMAISRSSAFDFEGGSQEELGIEATDALERALELDPDLPRVNAALAVYYLSVRLDIELATQHARRAMQLAPNAAYANYALANVLVSRGEVEELVRAVDRAISMDPLNPTVRRVGNDFLALYGRGDDMNIGLQHCVDRESDFICLAGQYQAAGHAGDEAAVNLILADLATLNPTNEEQQYWLVDGFEDGLDFQRASAAARFGGDDELAGRFEQAIIGMVGPRALITWSAEPLARAGYVDQALDVLFEGYFDRWTTYNIWNLTEGAYAFPDTLRRHPRFHEYWALPGMAELAAVRRANGQTAGLPLPMEAEE